MLGAFQHAHVEDRSGFYVASHAERSGGDDTKTKQKSSGFKKTRRVLVNNLDCARSPAEPSIITHLDDLGFAHV